MNINSATENSTYTNAAYSSKGVSGMVSGIDTESLVQSMLSNIQNKIDKQNQQKQQLQWKQELYRGVISDINDFQNKYLNLTSNSCIRLASTYNTMKTSSSSKAVSVTAGSNAVDGTFNMQVARLATRSSVTSNKVGTGDIQTSSAKANSFEYDRSVSIKVGSQEVSVDLKGATDSDVVNRINSALQSVGSSSSVSMDATSKELTFSGADQLEISGSTAGMAILGLSGTVKSSVAKDANGNDIAGQYELKSSGFNENFAKAGAVNGNIDVTVDGVKKSFSIAEGEGMEDLAKKVQNAFGSTVKFEDDGSGKWKIAVEGSGRQISISANADTLEAIGFDKGTTMLSNQIIRSDAVGKLGVGTVGDAATELSFKINGTEIKYNATDSISSIMNKVNSSGAGVNLTYDELSAKFSLTSSSTGTGFDIKIEDDASGLFSKLGFKMNGDSLDQSTVKSGQNAVVNINGVTVERASNDFTYNGMTLSLKATTGNYELDSNNNFVENSDGTLKTVAGTTEDKAEISTTRDVDKVVDNLKAFVEDYNKLIEKLNKYTHEDPSYKKYPALTDAQKKEMTEKEIELWEEKAKEGLLRNDKDISSFLSDMRSAMYTRGDSKFLLSNIGINSSSQWSDYGKLSIDEDTLKAALTNNADEVTKLFTGENGLATRLNTACNKAASTSSGSPGTLVSIAGVKGKGTEKQNDIQTKLDNISKRLESLNRTYESKKERLWRQFNAMEQALQNMNSQSDYLAGYLGY